VSDVANGRLVGVAWVLARLAEDVAAIGWQTGDGAVPLAWFAHETVDTLAGRPPEARELVDDWVHENLPESHAVLEVRLVTPRCGYLYVVRLADAHGEWVARDDLTVWPL